MYPKIKIFEGFVIDSYTLMLSIALIVLLVYITRALEKKNGYSRKKTNQILWLFFISLGFTYLFAGLFDYLFHIIEDSNSNYGGITYLGGFIGGSVSFVLLLNIFMPQEKKNILKIFNSIIPGVIIGHAIGRVGCFLAGCCYGGPTESAFGVIYPDIPYSPRYEIFTKFGTGVHTHPTQIYESLFLFSLFITLEFNKKIKNYRLIIYLISYGIFRFIIEFFRGDNRGKLFLGITPSQGLSVIIIFFGIYLIFSEKFTKKNLLK